MQQIRLKEILERAKKAPSSSEVTQPLEEEWKPEWMQRIIEETEREIAKEEERYQRLLSLFRELLGLDEIGAGEWIRDKAIKWLERKGYKLVTGIADEMTYFGAERTADYFWVIARGGTSLGAPLWDKIAHSVHEVVEVNEIKKRLGRVLPHMQYTSPKLRRVRETAHGVAERVEALFLQEYRDWGDEALVGHLRG